MRSLLWVQVIILCGVASLAAFPAAAQQQQPSLGEIARRAREQKEKKQVRKPAPNRGAAPPAGSNDLVRATAAPPQSIDEQISLGEVARRNRAQTKPAAKTSLLWTDDDPLTVSGAEVKEPAPARGVPQPSSSDTARRVPDDNAPMSQPEPAQINRTLPEPSGAAPVQFTIATKEILEAGRTFLKEEKFGEAIRLLEDARKRFPGDLDIKLELGRAYLYDGKDEPAVHQFKEVLLQNPVSRQAKLQLARALGYQSHYQESDQLYRELLQSNPDDELASIGLIRNLLEENHLAEARQELQISLAHHPRSQRLQEYQQILNEEQESQESPENRKQDGVQTGENYVTDSSGNSSWRSSHLASYIFDVTGGFCTR